MISLLGIVIGLALFILLAFIGYNTIIVAIAAGYGRCNYGRPESVYVVVRGIYARRLSDSCRDIS